MIRSLSEYLKISAPEIRNRKALLGFTERHAAELAKHQQMACWRVDRIVDRFYEKQTGDPGIAAIIGDSETLDRLRRAMRKYVLDLFAGSYDLDYVNSRLRIGKVHARIGVPPKYYVASMVQLADIVVEELDAAATNTFLREALRRLFMFDLQFVFDTYILGLVQEVELARDDLVAYSESLEKLVEQRTRDIERMANTDALTGLPNRRVLFAVLGKALAGLAHPQNGFTLAFIDLDDFKAINDTYGHVRGDEVLMLVAEAIGETLAPGGRAFRYGGDEFCLVMEGCSVHDALAYCAQLAELLARRSDGLVRFSYGAVAADPETTPDADALLRAADAAMYADKKSGAVAVRA